MSFFSHHLNVVCPYCRKLGTVQLTLASNESLSSNSHHSHWSLCFPVSDLRYMKANSEIWHFWRLLWHVVFKIRCSFETNRESNVTMDESSVAEEPKFSSSYISSVAEERLISAWKDEDFSHGEETTAGVALWPFFLLCRVICCPTTMSRHLRHGSLGGRTCGTL